MGTWGLALSLTVLLMFVAGLAAAALYLETGQPRQSVTGEPVAADWPPQGIERPGWQPAALAFVLATAAGCAVTWATRLIERGTERPAAILTAGGVAAWVASALVLATDLQTAGFSLSEHAYTSVYWILTCATITFVAVGAIMAASVLVQILTGVIDTDRHLELANTAGYAWFTVVTAAALLGLVHLLPVVGGGT